MSTSAISLARLLELNVPRSWHEAVAVALQAGDAMKLAGTAVGVAACVIDERGELRLEGGGPRGTDAAAAVASLLASLLEGQTVPAELRALSASPGTDRPGGIDGLMQALAYYERPNRSAEIAALATRALAVEAQARADSELARLRSGPRADVPAPGAEPAAPAARRRPVVGLATVLVLVVAAAIGVTWYLNRPAAGDPPGAGGVDGAPGGEPAAPPSTMQSLVSAASDALTSVADAGLRAVGLATSEPAPAAPAAAPPATGAPAARRAPRAAAEGSSARAVEPAPAAVPVPAPTVNELPVVVAEPDESAMPPEAPPGPFTEADADVEPPVLIYPQLPSEAPPSPPANAPHFELLVNERGEVDQVRLRATDARFQDRMMVSAAKAWRFRPAMKDGKPVRYRVRVPISR